MIVFLLWTAFSFLWGPLQLKEKNIPSFLINVMDGENHVTGKFMHKNMITDTPLYVLLMTELSVTDGLHGFQAKILLDWWSQPYPRAYRHWKVINYTDHHLITNCSGGKNVKSNNIATHRIFVFFQKIEEYYMYFYFFF